MNERAAGLVSQECRYVGQCRWVVVGSCGEIRQRAYRLMIVLYLRWLVANVIRFGFYRRRIVAVCRLCFCPLACRLNWFFCHTNGPTNGLCRLVAHRHAPVTRVYFVAGVEFCRLQLVGDRAAFYLYFFRSFTSASSNMRQLDR